jgi:hypothetical protein
MDDLALLEPGQSIGDEGFEHVKKSGDAPG